MTILFAPIYKGDVEFFNQLQSTEGYDVLADSPNGWNRSEMSKLEGATVLSSFFNPFSPNYYPGMSGTPTNIQVPSAVPVAPIHARVVPVQGHYRNGTFVVPHIRSWPGSSGRW